MVVKRREIKQFSYWVKTSAKFTVSSCRMIIHLQPQNTSRPLKTLDLYVLLKRGVQVKGPYSRKKIPDESKKVICTFISCTMVSEAIPIIMMSWIPDLSSFHFAMERQTNGGGYCSLYLVHKYAELFNNMALKCPFVDLQNK